MGTVKQQFITSNPETYHEFIEFMNRYVHKRNEAGQHFWLSEVVDTVIRLFADHTNLLRGFIEYLPTCVEDAGLAKN